MSTSSGFDWQGALMHSGWIALAGIAVSAVGVDGMVTGAVAQAAPQVVGGSMGRYVVVGITVALASLTFDLYQHYSK